MPAARSEGRDELTSIYSPSAASECIFALQAQVLFFVFCNVRLVKAGQTAGNHVSFGARATQTSRLFMGLRRKKQAVRFIRRYLSVRTDRQAAVGAAEGRPGDTLEEMDGGVGQADPARLQRWGLGSRLLMFYCTFRPSLASLSQRYGRLPLSSPPVSSRGFQENTNSPVKPHACPKKEL